MTRVTPGLRSISEVFVRLTAMRYTGGRKTSATMDSASERVYQFDRADLDALWLASGSAGS